MMVRTTAVKAYKKPIHNVGGHLHNPPRDCPCPGERRRVGIEGVVWIDLLWCNMICPQMRHCRRKDEFHKEMKRARKNNEPAPTTE